MNKIRTRGSPKIMSVYSLAKNGANTEEAADVDGFSVNGELGGIVDTKEKEDILKEEDAVAIASCLDPNLEHAADTENSKSIFNQGRKAASLQVVESGANDVPTLGAKEKGKKNASDLCSHEEARQKGKRGRKSLNEDDRDPTYVMDDSFQSSDDEVEPIKRRLRRAPKKRKLGMETFTQHLEAKRPGRGKRSQDHHQARKESKVASPQTGQGEKFRLVMNNFVDGGLSHDERMRKKEKNIEHLKYLIRQQEEAIEKIRQEKKAENVQRVEAATSVKVSAGKGQGKPLVADLRKTPLLLPKMVTVVSNGVHVPIPGASLTSAIQSLKVSPGTKIVQIIPKPVTSSTSIGAALPSPAPLTKSLLIKHYAPGTSEARTMVFSSPQSNSSSATVNPTVSLSNGQWVKQPTHTTMTAPSFHVQAPVQGPMRPEIPLQPTFAASRTLGTPIQPVTSMANPRAALNNSGGGNLVRLPGGLSGNTNISGVFVSVPVPNSTEQQLVFVPNHITPNIVSPGATTQLLPGTGHVRASASPQVSSGSQVVMLPLQRAPNGMMLSRPVLVQPNSATSSSAAPQGERIITGVVPPVAPAPAKRLLQSLPKKGSTTVSTTTSFVVQSDRSSPTVVSSGQGDSTSVTTAPSNTTLSQNISDLITVSLTRSTTTERVVVTIPKATREQNGPDQTSLTKTTIGITTCTVNDAQEHRQNTEKPGSNNTSVDTSVVDVTSAESPSKCLQPTSFIHAKNVLKNALSSKMRTPKDDGDSDQSSDALSVLKSALKTHFTPDALKPGGVTVKKELSDTDNRIDIETKETIPGLTNPTSASDSLGESSQMEAVPKLSKDSGVMYSKFPISRSPPSTDVIPALSYVKPSVTLERKVRAKVLWPNGQYVSAPLPGGLVNTVPIANGKAPGPLVMGKKNQQQLSGILVKLKDGGVRFVKLADDGKVDKQGVLKANTGVLEEVSSMLIKKEFGEMVTPQTSSCETPVTTETSCSALPTRLKPFSCNTSAPLQHVAGGTVLDTSGALPTMISQSSVLVPSSGVLSALTAGSALLAPSSRAIADGRLVVGTDSKLNSEQQGAAHVSVSAELGKSPTLILRTGLTEDRKKVGIPLGKQERLIQLENRTRKLHSFVPRTDDVRFTCLTGLESVVQSLSEWEDPI